MANLHDLKLAMFNVKFFIDILFCTSFVKTEGTSLGLWHDWLQL
jgi:hypothetical protein